MKVNKIRFSTWLSLVNLVSIIGYLGYFGYWYFQKQPKFSGQRLLLIEVASGIVLLALPFAIELIGKFYFPQIELVFYFVFSLPVDLLRIRITDVWCAILGQI
ncbi:hypothetical protein [Lentilactobacillus kosonis]|uniref:hypothetical protein n=1 Tax=Lentilactobacillus kosonis TaxID=2810561 RepID=UPI001CDBFF12|nr:hypothetical protein [Lentilactobacillus kosonis]